MKNLIRKIKRTLEKAMVNAVIYMFARRTKDFFFIEIGAGNGIANDFIRYHVLKWKWRGVLIEPVKYIFEELVNNYKGYDNLIFENISISDKNEVRNFYRLKKTCDDLPIWYDQLGSFNRDVVLKHKKDIPNIEDYLIVERMECITLRNLLQKHSIKRIDFLSIDTEGYDYALIKSIDFNVIKPKIIRYEYKHLGKRERDECVKLLRNNGYAMIIQENDVFAFLRIGSLKI
ncbi:MAG: FkbM family methyltransferase [Candidatus Omnitrophica bacterium]|nr:FkbM family methyltransferase [Candidatus Omnitrophota bacterium]